MCLYLASPGWLTMFCMQQNDCHFLRRNHRINLLITRQSTLCANPPMQPSHVALPCSPSMQPPMQPSHAALPCSPPMQPSHASAKQLSTLSSTASHHCGQDQLKLSTTPGNFNPESAWQFRLLRCRRANQASGHLCSAVQAAGAAAHLQDLQKRLQC